MLKALLAHSLTRGLDLDDPRTTELRRRIIRENKFLQRIYHEWYRGVARALPTDTEGAVLELGAGAGFLHEFIPDLIASEIFECSDLDVVLDGLALPFADSSLRAIVMTDVMHHLPRPRQFFTEAARCVGDGGRIVMIEPWVTAWSRLIYSRLHHEPFQPKATIWEFPERGPLSGANGALPWIIFQRDRAQFESEFPMWCIESVRPLMPFRYLVSGGVSLRSFMPVSSFGFWRWLENGLTPWMGHLAMFAQIVLKRAPAR